jgi:hypothetical protein
VEGLTARLILVLMPDRRVKQMALNVPPIRFPGDHLDDAA